MKRNIYILGFVVLLLTLSTCGPDQYYVTIQGIIPPDDSCTYKPQDLYQAFGILDAEMVDKLETWGYNYGYIAGVQVENRMLNTKDVTKKPGSMDDLPMKTDVNFVIIKKAVITLRAVSASKNTVVTTANYKSTFTMEVSETIIPSAGDDKTPGRAIVLLPLIPKEKIREMFDTEPNYPFDLSSYMDISVEFSLEGETRGGVPVKTSKHVFPVKICYGCLDLLGNRTLEQCLTDTNCKLSGNTCLPGQDGQIICTCN